MIRVNYWKKVSVLMLVAVIGLTVVAQAEPKNVIFFIGDGMGPEQVQAGNYYLGGSLSFESFPYSGELTTYSADASVTDSAAAATALATGFKVNNGVISMDGSTELETLLEYSKLLGKSTGLVTTVYVTHATPAGFGAHEPDRNNYPQIANDYLTQTRPNVIYGGASYIGGAAGEGYTVVTNRAEMLAYYDAAPETMLSGQFDPGDMPYEADYDYDTGTIPRLSEMTDAALSILDNDADGFFLMVEGGNIDHACHDNHTPRTVLETVEFANAVQVAIDWAAGRTDTLIIVCADHETGGLTVTGNNGQYEYPSVTWSSTGHTAANVPVYAWGVNAELISGVMDNTDMFAVVTATISPEASNPSPGDGVGGVDIDADLSWTAGSGATMHQIYFAGDSVVEQPLGNETYDPGQLLPGTAYSWRIDEVGPGGTTTGAVWSFTTAAAPSQVTGESPGNGASNVDITTDLNWEITTELDSYDVYFGDSYPPASIGNQATITYDPGTLNAGATYYWQIDSVGAGGTTTGAEWSFTTAAAPGQAYEPQPPNGTLAVLLETDLSWSAGSGANAHDVYLGVELETLVLVSEGQTATTFEPGTLDSGTTYYWAVDEVGPGGVTPGQIWTFATAALPWTDGFESGGLTAGGWVTSGQVQVTDDAFTGSYAVRTNRAASLEKAINTAGFGSITVRFAAKTFGMDSGEFLYVEWSQDGTSWDEIDTTANDVTQWTSKIVSCPTAAEDNADFRVRFRSNANKNREYVFIDDVQISGIPLGPDETPPTPSPMEWVTPPYATGENSIAMTATIASDPSGVEYYFACTAGGGNDSGWQDSPTYEDTGLDSDTTYTYTVTARDKSENLNETAASAEASATTDAPDTTPPEPDPMTWDVVPYVTSKTSIAMTATTASDVSGVEYYFACTVGIGGHDSGWQDSPTYEDTGLTTGTEYTYQVKARDKSPLQNETGLSSPASATPVDLPPAPPTGLAATAGDGQVSLDWNDNTETDLAGYNVYRSQTSGSYGAPLAFVTESDYVDNDVVNGTTYYYVVTAVDSATPTPNESGYSSEVSATPTAQVGDVVTIVRADYRIRQQVFTVQATSSQGGVAVLTVVGYGTMTYNVEENLYTFRQTVATAPGDTVTVESDFGGSDTASVTKK